MVEWSLNPLVAIGIALGVMFFGYFFGLAEGNNKGYKKRQKEEGEERKLTPPVDPLPPGHHIYVLPLHGIVPPPADDHVLPFHVQ